MAPPPWVGSPPLIFGVGSLLILLFGKPVPGRRLKSKDPFDMENGCLVRTDRGPFDPWI